MIAKYKVQTNVLILIGLAAQVIGFIGVVAGDGGAGIFIRLIHLGDVLIVVGCCFYAKGKGYNGAWGLLGLLSIIGLLILICMKDKEKELVRCTPSRVTFTCPNCHGGMEYNGTLRPGQKVQCPHCRQTFVIRPMA